MEMCINRYAAVTVCEMLKHREYNRFNCFLTWLTANASFRYNMHTHQMCELRHWIFTPRSHSLTIFQSLYSHLALFFLAHFIRFSSFHWSMGEKQSKEQTIGWVWNIATSMVKISVENKTLLFGILFNMLLCLFV